MKRPLFGNETRLTGYDRSIEAATPLRGNESCHFATMNRSVAEQRHALHGRVAPAMERDRWPRLCGVAPHARLSFLRGAACTIAARNPVADGPTKTARILTHHGRQPCKSKETLLQKQRNARSKPAMKRSEMSVHAKQWNVTGAWGAPHKQHQRRLQRFRPPSLHASAPPSRTGPDDHPAICCPADGVAIPSP